jgi:acyl-CoA dehydrogenase
MTRSFMIIGQGITRCHPHMLSLIQSLQSEAPDAPAQFRGQFFKMVGHVLSNFGASITRGAKSSFSSLFRSSDAYKKPEELISHHEAQLSRLSANFAFAADLSLLLGGRLKYEELLMGRLADALGAIYLGYSTLHHFSAHRSVDGLAALAESTLVQLEYEAQEALREAAANFPRINNMVPVGWALDLGVGTRPYRPPSDALTKEVAHLLTTPSQVHDLFARDVYVGVGHDGKETRVTELLRALPLCVEADALEKKLKKEKRDPTSREAELLAKAVNVRDKLVQVDVHAKLGPLEQGDGYTRPAILSTQNRLKGSVADFAEVLHSPSAPTAAAAAASG